MREQQLTRVCCELAGAANGGSAARAEYGNNGYPAPHFPTFQPDSSAAGFYPAQPAYHAFAPSYPPMGMLDPNMRVHPSVGVPPMAMTDPAALSAAIQYQVEYYLSIDNLLRDLYLRGHMDMGGWVPLSHLATFKRLSTLSTNIAEIAACLTSSVEVSTRTRNPTRVLPLLLIHTPGYSPWSKVQSVTYRPPLKGQIDNRLCQSWLLSCAI